MKRGDKKESTLEDQIRARAMWKRALTERINLSTALMCGADDHDREYWHQRLDIELDRIEKFRANALELFPDVEESFTVASVKI